MKLAQCISEFISPSENHSVICSAHERKPPGHLKVGPGSVLAMHFSLFFFFFPNTGVKSLILFCPPASCFTDSFLVSYGLFLISPSLLPLSVLIRPRSNHIFYFVVVFYTGHRHGRLKDHNGIDSFCRWSQFTNSSGRCVWCEKKNCGRPVPGLIDRTCTS